VLTGVATGRRAVPGVSSFASSTDRRRPGSGGVRSAGIRVNDDGWCRVVPVATSLVMMGSRQGTFRNTGPRDAPRSSSSTRGAVTRSSSRAVDRCSERSDLAASSIPQDPLGRLRAGERCARSLPRFHAQTRLTSLRRRVQTSIAPRRSNSGGRVPDSSGGIPGRWPRRAEPPRDTLHKNASVVAVARVEVGPERVEVERHVRRRVRTVDDGD